MSQNSRHRRTHYWRSLDQLVDSPKFRTWLHREFPQAASEFNNNWSRRSFLTLMGASMALAGLAGCRRPAEKIVPYVKQPEEIIPGVPRFYATTMPMGNAAIGLVVENHEGRPTKIEGNRLHPASLGRTNARIQASLLDLYDPDRSQRVRQRNQPAKWDDFVAFWQLEHAAFVANEGEGLAVLTEPFASPTLARLTNEFRRRFSRAQWATWEPVSDENVYDGVQLATNEDLQPLYHFDQAEVILSLDADFLHTESENVLHAKQFADGRRVAIESDTMNRLYVVEPIFSLTGAMADHRLPLLGRHVGAFAHALAVELKRQGLQVPAPEAAANAALPGEAAKWLAPLAKDLMRRRGRSLIVAGRRQPPPVHALALAINDALGNVGSTVTMVAPQSVARSSLSELTALTRAMQDKQIKTLLMLGGNPVYDAPADLSFAGALKQVEHTVHLSSHVDETSAHVEWHLPRSHYLESWGDARSADGTLSVIQPLIEPLFESSTDIELLQLVSTGREGKSDDIVRNTWKGLVTGNFEREWQLVLHDGLRRGNQPRTARPQIRSSGVSEALKTMLATIDSSVADLEIVFHTDSSVGSGSQANNGWLQELPDPITKVSWDNVATMSPATAKSLGVKNEDLIRLRHNGRELALPSWIVPGQADRSVAIALGYGRTHAGRVGNEVGANTYALRTSGTMDFGRGLQVVNTGGIYPVACTQDHGSMAGRPIVREASLQEYRRHPDFVRDMVEHPPLKSLFGEHAYDQGYQWGMAIDLNVCTGCHACTLACQSENNIPIVGKEQVRNGREMHWLRVDRYFTGDAERPGMVHQPVACQHCENAPCEQVCPVAATVHDKEGLNTMVYNRCIGTRYCSNNCPYKVRRFNFFNFTKDYPEIVKMAQNPDVTVRSRGVMEKCTYCLQRISQVKMEAKNGNREVRDGDLQTACQQVCPTGAISFGNVNDSNSIISQVKRQNRNYELLGEYNVRPRTSYLAKLTNPNPDMS